MDNLIELDKLQQELGYEWAGPLSPVAFLGLLGEAGEVAEHVELVGEGVRPMDERFLISFQSSAEQLDELKKKIRKGQRDNVSAVIVNPDELRKELADQLYYLNIVARQAGVTLDQLAAMSVEKVRRRTASEGPDDPNVLPKEI